MVIIMIVVRLLFAAAVCFAFSKHSARLIPGYRAMTDEQKAEINGKAFSRVLGGYLVLLWLGFEIFPWIERFVWLVFVVPLLILAATVLVVAWVSKQLKG